MKFEKKQILKLISENITEMAMDFDSEDRPDAGIQRSLERGDTPYKNVPLPETGNENQNFQELLASDRYKQVIQNLRHYTGINRPMRTMMDVAALQGLMMTAHNTITQIESQHREELENLALKLVKDYFGIPEGIVEFDAKIVGMGEISTENFNMDMNDEEQEMEVEENLFQSMEEFDLEKAKRRFINGIIQGASKRGHYMYHMVTNELREITGNDDLINQYGILMSINDTMYWQLGDDIVKQMSNMVGGKEQVETSEEKAKIIARGINFPVLVHELIKGVMEVIGIFGRHKEGSAEVEESQDKLVYEMWDLRLGPVIWDKLYALFPEEALMDNKELKMYILQAIFKLPAKNFFTFFKHVLSNSAEGEQMMAKLLEGITKMMNGEEEEQYEEDIEEFKDEVQKSTDEMTEDEINKFLDDMLKKRKKENPEQ